MQTATQTAQQPKAMIWTGRVLSGLVTVFLLFNGVFSLIGGKVVEQGMAKYGFAPGFNHTTGVLLLVCAVLYAIPQTAMLGAVLLTGYLGGAVVTHLRAGEAPTLALVVAAIAWLGVFLREARLRALLPIRR